MKIKIILAFVISVFFCTAISAKTTTSQASGDWNTGGTWNNGVPGVGDIINIQAAHTVTLSAAFNNTGGTITVDGTFVLGVGGSFTVNGTINMNAGSFYNHSQNGGTIPTCTWNATSTCTIIGAAGVAVPGALGQSFGNFTWNWSTQGGTVNLAGALTSIAGNFTISNLGTNRILQLATTTSPTINIGGNLVMAGSTSDLLQFATTGSPIINVSGNFTLSGGKVLMCTTGSPVLNVTGNFSHSSTTATVTFVMTSGAGNPVINVTGNFTYSASISNGLVMSSSTGIGTINLFGDFAYTAATAARITETSSGKGKFFFKKSGTQTFGTAFINPFANTIELTVNVGSTVDMSATTASLTLSASTNQFLTVNGTLVLGTKTITTNIGTTFTLASGGTLNTSNVNGVNPSIVAGGTRTFNNGANYILANASTTTGFTGANTIMNDLTLTASAVLGEAITVNGILLNSTGTFSSSGFTIDAGTITNNATFTTGGSTLNAVTMNNGSTFNAGTSLINVSGTFTNTGTFNASTSVLSVGGDFSNSGTFSASTGTVTFNGATQSIGGTSITSFNNITHSSTVGTDLAQDANLLGVLSITDGTFNTTGFNFTLVSDISGTASIGEITGAGDFNGNIIMQRFVDSSPTDWRFFCSPVTGATIADWADDFATSGFTGATCGPADCASPGCAATCNYPSIYWYDESAGGDLDQGYTAIIDVNDPITDGTGYWVYLGPNPVTFEVTGPPNKFANPLFVSYNPNNGIADDGWCMVSNPYPCAIDWDDIDWTKTSIDDAVYIYNASTGTFASYITGSGVNGGTNVIASQQAFWVKANTDVPAPVLDAAEGVKITGAASTFLKMKHEPNTSYYPSAFKDFPVPLNTNNVSNSLRLVATGNGYDDELLIRFKQNATTGFDSKFDAWKLVNTNTFVLNFSSVISGNDDLSINTLPALTSDVSIPIRLNVPVAGTYTISRDSTLMIPLSSCIVLEDLVTASSVDLRTFVSYSYTVSPADVSPRFVLHVYAPVTKSSVRVTCPGDNNGKAIAKGIGAGPWDYVWKNSAGSVVKTTTGSSTADTLLNCLSDTYSVTVTGAYCGSVTDTVHVNSPANFAVTPSSVAVSCFGGNNGSAAVSPSGGNPSYSYLWENGETTSAVNNLLFGSYSVAITDALGCTTTASVAVSQPSLMLSVITPVATTCFALNDGSAFISTSGGSPSYAYVWDNGQSIAGATNLSVGSHSVLVTDAAGCTSTATVSIAQPALLTSTVTAVNISCFGQTDGSFSIAASGGTAPYGFYWDNGDTISSTTNFAVGTYPLTFIDANGCVSTTTVSISEPAVLTNTVSATNASCFGQNDGVASAVVSGGTAPYSYSWDNGQSTSAATNLLAGNYSVAIVDSRGCTSTATAVITQPGLLTAGYTASSYTVDIALGSNVTFTNTSSGAVSYQWNFGDASGIDISVDPVHSYTATGSYTVTLVSSDGPCSDTSYSTIVVIDSNPTALNESHNSSNINVGYENGEVFLLFSLDKATEVNIGVYNMLGEEIYTKHNLTVKNGKVRLELPSSSAGIYIAVSEMTDEVVSKKIIFPSR